MSPLETIDRPIFLLGCGRSGTTVIYDILCGHPRFGWFSSYSQRWPRHPELAMLSVLHDIDFLRRHPFKGFPAPSEGHTVWDVCKPVPDSPGDPPLTEEDADDETIARARRMVALHLRYQRKSRFINKNTRNTRRLRFLDRIFPDARFVHVLRDPLAVTASLLKVRFWPTLKVWSEERITPRTWEVRGGDPAVLAARLWVAEVEAALQDREILDLDDSRYLEVHYEELVEQPGKAVARVLAFAGLNPSPRFERHLARFKLQNMNHKFRWRLSPSQIARIRRITGPLAERLGYHLRGEATAPNARGSGADSPFGKARTVARY